MASVLGAVIGGLWGWLYLTEGGRRIRDQIEPNPPRTACVKVC